MRNDPSRRSDFFRALMNLDLRCAVPAALRYTAVVLVLAATHSLAGTVTVTGTNGFAGTSGTQTAPNGTSGTDGASAVATTSTPHDATNTADAIGGSGGDGGDGFDPGGTA